jgi:hypothetical protein
MNADHQGKSPTSGSPMPGLQVGVRALVFEGYLDHDRFAESGAVSRGIVGLRGGFGTSGLRLVLRAGVGGLVEEGGALSERLPGVPDRRGFVALAGVSLEGSDKVPGTDLLASLGDGGKHGRWLASFWSAWAARREPARAF